MDAKKIQFSEVFKSELSAIQERRANHKIYADPAAFNLPGFETCLPEPAARSDALNDVLTALNDEGQNKLWSAASDKDDYRAGLIGLAFSGGGIRSSSFNLGILQGVHKAGLFECIDYLSTVSGGGYIGSYLSSYYHRERKRREQRIDKTAAEISAAIPFPFKHVPGEKENDYFRHFRNNSNFLAPGGFFDLLIIPLMLLRGLIINLAVILPFLLATAVLMSYWLGRLPVNGKPSYVALHTYWYNSFELLPDNFPFPVTTMLAVALVLMSLAYPIMQMYLQKCHFGNTTNQRLRETLWRGMSWILVMAGVVFFIELQPLALVALENVLAKGIVQSFAAVSALAVIYGHKLTPKLSALLARLAVSILGIAGLLVIWILLLWLTSLLFNAANPDRYRFLYMLGAGILILYTALTVDVNFTSIHKFYRDRLCKAFMAGAEPPQLSQLDTTTAPYHLINTAVNVIRAPEEEAYKNGRYAGFFIFSKNYIGGMRTGYIPTRDMEAASRHVDLGTAMAISGAAVAPVMGKFTNPVLTFILGLLNLRLNYWLPNPWHLINKGARHFLGAREPFRRVGPWYLLREMFGLLDARSRYVNLSDGGHIENLGIYELLRRQCRLIIAGDGEADNALTFDGLAAAIRMARIDFGYHVEMDGLDEIRGGLQQHAIGTIFYPGGRIGKLIYLKSCLSGDNSLIATLSEDNYRTSPRRDDNLLFDDNAYIARYKNLHPDFPHESTGDQFFDEAQFECYRALGYSVAVSALTTPWRTPAPPRPV
ncbi:MAG: putative Acyl transferase/acyl hydrolase/lysophospholipase [Gammaproteobacteria bacterium]|nr:putative Acyl transferase/acyl hydrolase/lysophospholipase [Gammaproteobacteria bacterium]